MTARSETFDECLNEIVSPALDELGFEFDKSRTYRRLNTDKTRVEVINFQLGQRRLEGRFTVNLGVTASDQSEAVDLAKAYPHDCRFQTRIGPLLPPRSELLKNVPYLGMFFGAHDKWWRFSEDKAFTSRQVEDVFDKIMTHGIPWLEAHAS